LPSKHVPQRVHAPSDDGTSVIAVNVVGDGNCLPRAIACSLGRGEDAHESIRQAMATELTAYKENFYLLFFQDESDFKKHLRIASTDGECCGAEQIYAISNALNIVVALHTQTHRIKETIVAKSFEFIFLPLRREEQPWEKLRTIHISWSSAQVTLHYISLQNVVCLPSEVYHIPREPPEMKETVHNWMKERRTYKTVRTAPTTRVSLETIIDPDDERNDTLLAEAAQQTYEGSDSSVIEISGDDYNGTIEESVPSATEAVPITK
jgi:hypothetical protein